MSAKDFKFVSPGVFIEEIDNSQLPKSPVAIGPLVIGRTRRGPAYQPVRVDSFSEFVSIFGNPVAGEEASDLWRSGVPTAPTFAAYAAQAWLKNSSPLTVIRLLGDQSPDASDTDYGKAGWKLSDVNPETGGGAYGLFVLPSSSDNPATETVTGSLAAVFYTTGSVVALSGTYRNVEGTTGLGDRLASPTGSAAMVVANNSEFTLQAYDSSENLLQEAVISFDRGSSKYVRKVVNTNPTLTNTSIVDTDAASRQVLFLGQTYERAVADLQNADNLYGFIARLDKTGAAITNGNDFKFATQHARTGWFFSQDLRPTAADGTPSNNVLSPAYNPENLATVTRLFKLHGLTSGEEIHRNFKISIEDLQYSRNDNTPYGSFTLAIRDIKDSDNSVRYIERFTNLSLDPNSDSYIAKQIGDKYYEWSDEQRRLIEYGNYENKSSIVRVQMANSVDQGQVDPEALPFGAEGPIKYRDFSISGSAGLTSVGSTVIPGTANLNRTPVTMGGVSDIFMGPVNIGQPYLIAMGPQSGYTGQDTEVALSASVEFPSIPLRNSASDGDLSELTEAYFGAQFSRGASDSVFEESCLDILYPVARANTFAPVADDDGDLVTSWYFSMDDLVMKETSNQADIPVVFYRSGSRAEGDSISARSGSYKSVLDKGYDRFTTPLYGGFDGFDITEKEPFNQSRALTAGGGGATGGSDTTSAMFYSVKKAVDMFSDPEFIESNIIVAPGVRHEGLTTHMIETCETRGDAFALIDPYGGYEPASENSQTEQQRIDAGAGRGGVSQHVLNVGTNLEDRNLNSSYGATYYPWVRISDTISGRQMWAPPSIAALGAMSYSENESALWFAPAGFNRGGLTDGAAGIPVTNVRSRLTSKERDYLYERNVNPIASFPNEGIVIFGQKTLQVTPSALDRINVRRLMIFVKKEISRIAANLLFDQNTEQTWSRFTGQVNPFLENIKNNFGLDDFRVILDETTTTPDLIDRNTIYAKIFLKPTKAVEFFAIDFVITNSGAGFED
jgi:phage tail sheath protein FI